MKICMLCISLILFALPAIAETYTWEDDLGTVNFTEDLGNVPKKYRKKGSLSKGPGGEGTSTRWVTSMCTTAGMTF